METVAVEAHRIGTQPRPGELERDIERARAIARAMDAQFEIGGLKFGWDAIVGLVPVAGDIATALIGLYPILIAKKHNLSKVTRARMAANLVMDWAIGAIPLAGDVFDVAFKANIKNLELLEKAAEKARRGLSGS
jgi:hypothetical protein